MVRVSDCLVCMVRYPVVRSMRKYLMWRVKVVASEGGRGMVKIASQVGVIWARWFRILPGWVPVPGLTSWMRLARV